MVSRDAAIRGAAVEPLAWSATTPLMKECTMNPAARTDRPSRAIALLSSTAALALVAVLAAGARAADRRVVFSFDEDEGRYPDTDLVLDAEGRLYGMPVQGGDSNGGTVFRLPPTATGWEHEVLHHFTGGEDGGQPYGGVTLDAE